ncbi:MAG TPA: DNA repair protein RecN [Acidimicrobiales bacterium]|nr:DNA repair protein RecN [Acidimicrobiales bacterium]
MLTELRVKDLGVINELTLQLSPGLTAVTGETGAGKTLVVEAIGLLLGSRADNRSVRTGAPEARIDGRFQLPTGEEIVLGRAMPADGRSRAYVDGAPATAGVLSEVAGGLVEMHGQHDHQALLTTATQRAALDDFGRISTARVEAASAAIRAIEAELATIGGDVHARAREIELLRHQTGEITDAGIDDVEEDAALESEEDALADASAYREAAWSAHEALSEEGGAADRLGAGIAALAGRAPLVALERRARALAAELDDLSSEISRVAESLVDDPERLEVVQARRRLFSELKRKYGDTLKAVLEFGAEAAARLAFLEGAAERSSILEQELTNARRELTDALGELAEARGKAAEPLAGAVQEALRRLALPRAEVRVEVAGDGGADVDFRLSTNPGEPPRPIAKVASGGELSRAMLALRLVLSAASATGRPKTFVFDEVDAGIGGEAALAVGRALAGVAREHQVLVVTHLPQVAAFADHQVAVEKVEEQGRAITSVRLVAGPERVVELSRMLSGQPASESAQEHAAELLESAAAERASVRAGRA